MEGGRRRAPGIVRRIVTLGIAAGIPLQILSFNVFPNLGYFVLVAAPVFVERVVDQPEVASASANRRRG